MTNTPDLASMMAKLDWKFRKQDNVDIEATVTINNIQISTTDRIWSIGQNIASGRCTSVLDGINQIEQALIKYIEPFLDLTKLQQPEPFWKPIKLCPLKDGIKYDLYIKTKHGLHREPDCIFEHNTWCKTKIMGEDGSLHTLPLFEFYTEFNVLAFAKIPPCEVKP